MLAVDSVLELAFFETCSVGPPAGCLSVSSGPAGMVIDFELETLKNLVENIIRKNVESKMRFKERQPAAFYGSKFNCPSMLRL